METITDYHNDLSHYGSTALRLYATNPLAFYHAFILGEHTQRDSKALAVGRAFHAAMDGSYDDEVAVAPDGIDRRTKEGKALWAAFEEEASTRTVITSDDQRLVMAMSDAVWHHKLARELIRLPGRSEVGHRFTHRGVQLKVRWDRLLDCGDVIEYKTLDAFGIDAPRKFHYACRDHRYDMQAALYSMGRDDLGMSGDHYFVAVTKTIPSQCMLVKSSPAFLARGRDALERTIDHLGGALARESLNPGPHNWVLPCFTDLQEAL